MTWLVYAVRLLSELALLLAVALGGAGLASGGIAVALGVVAFVVAATIWGVWIAPRATHRLDDPARLLVELALFVWGGAGFAVSGRPSFGIALVVVGWTAAIGMRWTGEPVPGLDPDSDRTMR
jgi:hypothetical protein